LRKMGGGGSTGGEPTNGRNRGKIKLLAESPGGRRSLWPAFPNPPRKRKKT